MSRVPLISLIIATHNRADWLPGAVKSAQEAGTNVEVVVVDDASTDQTPQLCKTFNGVRVVRLERNAYLAGARNAGIAASSGEYLAFMDDDDRRLPGSLDVQLSVLEAEPDASFIYGPVLMGNADRCEPTGEIRQSHHEGDIFWELLKGNFVYANTALVRRRCIEEVGLFDTTLRGLEDWYLWISLAERYRVLLSRDPVGIYRLPSRTSNQMSNDRVEMCKLSARAQLMALNLPRAQAATPTERRAIRRTFLNYLSYDLLHEARLAASESNFRKAAAHALTALRLNPLELVRPSNLMRLPASVVSFTRT